MKTKNPWDLLSNYFDPNKSDSKIPSGVADNILIAWPVILLFIKKYFPKPNNEKALDYGCGTGGFANKLCQLGFNATGMDTSSEMISKAKKAHGNMAKFLVGNTSLLDDFGPFNLITSIMTLQFIKKIDRTISDLSKSLKLNGLLIFAVHNPEYKNPKYIKDKALKLGNGITIPIYIRTANEYNKLAIKYGLEPILEEYPPFSEEFIAKYPEYSNEKVPEYLILGYKKNS